MASGGKAPYGGEPYGKASIPFRGLGRQAYGAGGWWARDRTSGRDSDIADVSLLKPVL